MKDCFPFDQPQRSMTLGDTSKLRGKWYVSEKLDGIRAVWTGKTLLTRSMRPFAWVPDTFLKRLPKCVPLDGEITGASFSDVSALSVTQESDAARAKWKNVKYNVFDLPSANEPFESRLRRLRSFRFWSAQVTLVDFTPVNNIRNEFRKVKGVFDAIVKKGGEGVMLCAATGLYEPKRSYNLLKYKKEVHVEAKITGFHQGQGKYHRKLGKFKCTIEGPKGKKTFFCGTGIPDRLREYYLFELGECVDIRTDSTVPVPQKGDTISVSCMEFLPSGVPRFPVYRGLRSD